MKSLISAFVISMFLAIGLFAQDTMKQNDTMMKSMKQDTMMTTKQQPTVQRRHHRRMRRHHRRMMRHYRRHHRRYGRNRPNPNSIT